MAGSAREALFFTNQVIIDMLEGKKIVLGITGSIAAYKAAVLIRLLVKRGAEVQVVITPAGKEFITPVTLSALSGKPVISEFFAQRDGSWHSHVALGEWADAMLVAPATASTLAKMACGVADNMLVTTYLSMKAPVFVAPAMDLDMFAHEATQRNLATLRSYGNHIIEPASGELASHLVGKGRMEEPEVIVELLDRFFEEQNDLAHKRIVVTAGPTYEKIDPVRFIGNYSSGKMGFALAVECAERGAQVTLITGPVSLSIDHPRITRVDVESAAQMYEAATLAFPTADAALLCAAVADFTPIVTNDLKLKRGEEDLTLTLHPTRDIAAALGAIKQPAQKLVGFALETHDAAAHAREKLQRKNLDFIVLNSLQDEGAGFRVDTNKVTLIDSCHETPLPLKSKREVARDIINRLVSLFAVLLVLLLPVQAAAQELNASVNINSARVQGTSKEVFTTLQDAIKEFLNQRKWTNYQYNENEKIDCSFNFTIATYKDDGSFTCELMVQSSRPVYNSAYSSTVFNFKDANVAFNYIEHDQLLFDDNMIDNNLTATLAYYAYLIIGLDLETMALKGGEEVLQKAMSVVNNAQSLGGGWKAFGDTRNRHALINDYLNGGLESFRQLQYSYHRSGLDEMASNPERGRTKITESLDLLNKAYTDKPLSILPRLFTEIKKDELVNIYSKSTPEEKKKVSELLTKINPSLSASWDKIKK